MIQGVCRSRALLVSHAGRRRFYACLHQAAFATSSEGKAWGEGESKAEEQKPAADTGARMGGMQTISIDRSGLKSAEPFPAGTPLLNKEPMTDMAAHLQALIQFRGGPITVAEYMKEVLTNPISGFYMNDVIGSSGDFITSPEISQMFGELIGIWSICTWQQMGSPETFRLVELGPGKGTLMADLLRGVGMIPSFKPLMEVHLVEVGTEMRKLQWATLACGEAGSTMPEGSTEGMSRTTGATVKWHRSLDEVPSDMPTIYIAHEFLDALPVHQFQLSERGWVERLVDVASDDSPLHLRFVLSPTATPATRLLLQRRLQYLGTDAGKHPELEISAMVMNVANELGNRVGREGGAALLIDYGQDGPYTTSLQGIREHRQVPVLESPGKVDLSAWVDFSAVRQAVTEDIETTDVATYGPITQAHFLHSLGIQARLESLSKAASDNQRENLQQGYARLVGSAGEGGLEDGMGQTYKAMVIANKAIGVPVAFENSEGRRDEVGDSDSTCPADGKGAPQ